MKGHTHKISVRAEDVNEARVNCICIIYDIVPSQSCFLSFYTIRIIM